MDSIFHAKIYIEAFKVNSKILIEVLSKSKARMHLPDYHKQIQVNWHEKVESTMSITRYQKLHLHQFQMSKSKKKRSCIHDIHHTHVQNNKPPTQQKLYMRPRF